MSCIRRPHRFDQRHRTFDSLALVSIPHHITKWGFQLMLFVAIWCLASATVDAAEPPNLIFIMADDLGYGDLGCYGQTRFTTPHLDQLAAEGTRFTQFYAGSTVCAPSRCVLMTGLHTGHCFIRGNGKDNLRPDDVTVAEVLKTAGYRTGMFGKWGLGHEGSSGLPTRQGFDAFFGYLDQHHAHNYYPTFLIQDEARIGLQNVVPNEGQWGQGVATEKRQYSHQLIMDRALQFVRASADQRFFLYLPLTIPHANNEGGKAGMEIPSLGKYAETDWPPAQRAHAAMIDLLDTDVGRLMQLLKDLDLDDNTVVFFTSDNGPHREGGNDPDFANSNGPLRGIKRSLHEGGIRVPLIVRWPHHIPANRIDTWVGGFQDVLPTLADLAGVAQSVPANLDGVSFAPTLLGQPDQAEHDHLYWAFYERGGARAIRQGNWKAVQQPIDTAVRLYDLSRDLGESKDVAEQHPDRVRDLTSLMDAEYAPSDQWKFPKPAQ